MLAPAFMGRRAREETGMDEATKLLEAVNRLGMAGCNVCPYLRSIDEIGGSWQAAMSLIAAHKLFYTKVYRHRTVYLSAEVYALLRCIRQGREPLYPYPARHLLDLLEQREPCTMQELKASSGLAAKTFQKAWQTLLETMAVTAWAPYQELNPQWSSMLYCTAARWEEAAALPEWDGPPEEAKTRLRARLHGTISEKDVEKLIRNAERD